MTKKEALEKARESSRQGGIWVAWQRFADNQYLATHYAIFVEFATLGDEQIAGFENGEQTF